MKAIFSVLIVVLTCIAVRAQVPALNSYPAARATIFLDFDGQYVQGTSWNWAGPIDAAPSGLSTAAITEIFNRVAEDYRIFNINITTDSTVYAAAPIMQRVRIIVTPTYSWYGKAGGVSYVGSFTWGTETPGWVFSGLLNNVPKNIAEAASHEAGHTLGLQHQSSYDGSCVKTAEYSSGQGSGQIGWAPIMGVGYSKNITTWFNGPNAFGCNSLQNDISVIAGSPNNFGLRPDDHSNSTSGASDLLRIGNDFEASGLINDSGDRDVFRFDIPFTTNFKLNVIPENVGTGNAGANIDIKVSLLNGAGDTIGRYNPSDLLDAGVDSNLNAGNYYLVVDGVSNINLADYGSVGFYLINGSLSSALPVSRIILNGSRKGNEHQLQWIIETAEKITAASIEYSLDGRHFNFLTAAGTTGSYSWTPVNAGSIFYRLRAVGRESQEIFSNIVSLAGSSHQPARLLSNIVSDEAVVVAGQAGTYQLLDITGQLIQNGKLVSGYNHIPLTILGRGLFFLRISDGNAYHTEKIMKQ